MNANRSTGGGRNEKEDNEINTRYDDRAVLSTTDSEKMEDIVSDDTYRKMAVPNVNIPERIVLCLDVCSTVNESVFKLGDGTSFNPLNMLKRIIDFFLHSKSALNKKSQYALVLLKENTALWVQNFTDKVQSIFNTLDSLAAEESSAVEFDLNVLFDVIKKHVTVPKMSPGHKTEPPAYVVRLLLIYSRSSCMPRFVTPCEFYDNIRNNLYFYIDILLAHEEDCNTHLCEQVYDSLQELDNGYSYVFEVGRNATKIHDCIAKLLAHPLQRPLQKNTCYNFTAIDDE